MANTRKASVSASKPALKPTLESPPEVAPAATKIAQVVALLQSADGATLKDLIETTGWLPHTTRAALTGLRKKGHLINKQSRDGVTVYAIAKAA